MSHFREEFSKNTTFVVQGLVTPVINQVIESIRIHCPGAEIIVSTCNRIDIDVIGADQIIRSDDPGAFPYSKEKGSATNNVNRQILSTLAGLKAVKTQYAFKLRSDFLLTGNSFLDFFEQFPISDEAYRIFERKLLACSYFSRNPHQDISYPYHVSDLAFFGLTTDLLTLFDVPLLEAANAYQERVQQGKTISDTRFWPEQYLLTSCLEKQGRKLECEYYDQATPFNCEQTERYFASNFILLTYEQFCLQPIKHNFNMQLSAQSFASCYTHNEWQALYRRYVAPDHPVPTEDRERALINASAYVYKKYRRIANLASLFCFDSEKRKNLRAKILLWLANRHI